MSDTPAAYIDNLRIEVTRSSRVIVEDFSLTIAPGEIIGLVGESGSGKTSAASALLGYVRKGARILDGEIEVGGVDIRKQSEKDLRRLYGSLIAYMPQDPGAALNPNLRIGEQLDEVFEAHRRRRSSQEVSERVAAGLREVRLPDDATFLRRYPHQLSGGQQQRVYLAMMFMLEPRIVILDEPTTGLDVTTQAAVLEAVRNLCRRHQTGAIYVSHDLAVVRSLADRVVVMKDGRVVEHAPSDELFDSPQHQDTKDLLAAVPDISRPLRGVGQGRTRDLDAVDRPILTADSVTAHHGSTAVLHEVSVSVSPGECVALVGESGSGKTTFSRVLIGLHTNYVGSVSLADEELAPSARMRTVEQRRRMQYVFQSPFESLNPRKTIGQSIGLAVRQFFPDKGEAVRERAEVALRRVSLPISALDRYPDELSGGERQRAAIARALVSEPELLLCDEITSALDVSVQAKVVELLDELRHAGLALLFVTHNLGLVRSIAQRVYVLQKGTLVESGSVDEVLQSPTVAYTQALIADTPTLFDPSRG